MKIQCDVCSRDEASVFCCADEAALCDPCDRRIHRANKLAGKHRRFSLSSAEQTQPLCDVCKERKGLVFCQEDRAILCWDCDDPIHSANELTMKHSRFLLTGARLSATPLSSTSPLKDVIELDHNNSNRSSSNTDNKVSVVEESLIISNPKHTLAPSSESRGGSISSSSSSSISEYLIKTLPGYCVEDLLFDDVDGSYKDREMVPFSAPDLAAAEEFSIWVPHVPQVQQPLSFISTGLNGLIHCNYGFDVKESDQKQQSHHHGANRARTQQSDESFMVPQISTPVSNSSNKRPRPSSVWEF